jgi:hypothetical protein
LGSAVPRLQVRDNPGRGGPGQGRACRHLGGDVPDAVGLAKSALSAWTRCDQASSPAELHVIIHKADFVLGSAGSSRPIDTLSEKHTLVNLDLRDSRKHSLVGRDCGSSPVRLSIFDRTDEESSCTRCAFANRVLWGFERAPSPPVLMNCRGVERNFSDGGDRHRRQRVLCK